MSFMSAPNMMDRWTPAPVSAAATCRLVSVPGDMIELLSMSRRSSAQAFARMMHERALVEAATPRVQFWEEVMDGLA